MSLAKTEKTQLKQLLQSPQWSALDHLHKDLIDKYKGEYGARDTEWETIRNTLVNEGKIRGLTELIQEIYKEIQSNE
jgi:hypothetical protein